MTDKMPIDLARQQFHNLDHFDRPDAVRPEWYEMPQVRSQFADGGTVVNKAIDLVKRAPPK